MELELALTLSSTNVGPILKELDLISFVKSDINKVFDDNSCLSSQSSVSFDGNKKRVFEFEFDEVESSVSTNKTLPLLVWDKNPYEEDNYPKRHCQSSSFTSNKNDGDSVVGWSPMKSTRKKQDHHKHGGCENIPETENGSTCGGLRSMHVKVQIEGCLITRKIDLKTFQSYESLTCTLLAMFGKGKECVDGYKLAYQDGDGDWLIARDVPWRTFIQLVQRLKLLRGGNLF